MDDYKLRTIYRIEGGILNGTEIEPFMFTILVRYPHRKSPDCYIPPMKANDKDIKTWHCCQDNCPNPNFEGKLDALIEHLMIHKGRLIRPWNRKHQLKSPLPAVKIPDNPWSNDNTSGLNEDRRFCVSLYIDNLQRRLKKQGLEVIKSERDG